MKKQSGQSLWVCVLFCAILILYVILDLGCPFRRLFGFPCPGCGMSRAWLAALRFDFRAAFAYHPMFWCVPVLMLYVLVDFDLFRRKWIGRLLLWLIFTGLILCYLLRLVTF